ncbi:GTP-binding protein [Propionivibrio sp.]|uniref:GTP-binding protein n=1 Tax=Propionivibrio sp. TaxID=2212460 RepID=UPI003BEFDE0C
MIEDLSERLNRINPRALQQQLEQGRAESGSLLGIGGFNLDTSLLATEANARSTSRFIPHASSATDSVRWSSRPAAHSDEISSFLLAAGEVDLEKIGAFVQSMIDEFGETLLRYKGILAIPNENRKLIFQGVQRVAGFDYGEAWNPDEARISRIVIIGKLLPEEKLRAAFLDATGTVGQSVEGPLAA